MSPAAWPDLVALALTGVPLDAAGAAPAGGSGGGPADPEVIAAALAAAGWDAEAIRAHALAELASGRGWPHIVDPSARRGTSPAQFWAVVKDVRRVLGLETLAVAAPSRRTVLDADERRLLADLPPHHVAH